MADKPVIKNRAPLGDLDLPLLRRVVPFGDEVEVEVEQAEQLLAQMVNWEAVNDAAKAIVKRLGFDQHGDAQSAPIAPVEAPTPAVLVPPAVPAAPAPSSPVTPAAAATPVAPENDATKEATA